MRRIGFTVFVAHRAGRRALEDDANEISAVILGALRETNAKDYAKEIIERVEHSFGPSAELQLISKRTVFVATRDHWRFVKGHSPGLATSASLPLSRD